MVVGEAVLRPFGRTPHAHISGCTVRAIMRLAGCMAAVAGPVAVAQSPTHPPAPPPSSAVARSSPARPSAPSPPSTVLPAEAPVSVLPPSFVSPAITPSPAPDEPKLTPSAGLEDLAAQLLRIPDVVVAEVAGTPITVGMVADGIRNLPPMWGTKPSKEVFDFVLNTLVQMRMLALKAKQEGLDRDPETQRRIAIATDRELAGALIKQGTNAATTDNALKARYTQEYASKPGPEEVWLRVIGASSKAAAQEALDKINGGSSFSAVTQEFSRDPSREAGGDLGYVSAETLPAELRAVAFALPIGSVSAFPLESNGLWYILEVEGRRQRGAPSLGDVTPLLEGELKFDAARSLIMTTRAATDIKIYGPSGLDGDKAEVVSGK
jgi:peptidyl-prolyl cis-trans isomerase C